MEWKVRPVINPKSRLYIQKKFKQFYFAILIFICLQYSYSQSLQSIGIKTGLCFANTSTTLTSFNDKHDSKFKNGFFMAASWEMLLEKPLAIVADMSFIQKGRGEDVIVPSPNDEFMISTKYERYNFLSFSAMAKIFLGTKQLSAYVLIGPKVDMYVSYWTAFHGPPYDETNFTKALFGINTGFGIERRVEDYGFSIEFLHTYDFNNFITVYSEEPYQGFTLKNSAYIINIGAKYYFTLE